MGARANNVGAAWETAIRADLKRWRRSRVIDDWQRQSPETRRVGRGGSKTIHVDPEGPVDFAAWSRSGAWAWEAKHCEAVRWPLSKLEPHQARRLTTWHCPALSRYAGIALRYDLEDGSSSSWLLDWGAIGPLWAIWSVGAAGRGDASIHVRDAGEYGVPWGAEAFAAKVAP